MGPLLRDRRVKYPPQGVLAAMAKTALIVDDSASARFILSRLLGEHELKVDTAESAEDALDYLTRQRPDVIFMDHLMPGMDGFQAVQAIKANPATATIPIMMYTSQEGELYVGQARALGAVGVLPKQVKPVEVSKMLHSLHLIPHDHVDDAVEESAQLLPPAAEEPPPQPHEAPVDELLQDLFHQQKVLLREEIRHGYARLSDDLTGQIGAEPPQDRRPAILGVGLVVAALVAVWFFYLYLQATDRWSEANERNAALLATVEEQGALIESQQTAVEQRSSPGGALLVALPVIQWAVNQDAAYGYDEIALNDRRAEMLEDLVPRLQDLGFFGDIEFIVHVGRFCSMMSPEGALARADGGATLAGCDQLGWPDEEAVMLGERQTLAFANAVAAVNGNSASTDIGIQIVAMGHRAPSCPYPPDSAEFPVEEWNRAAALNHRIEIKLLPS